MFDCLNKISLFNKETLQKIVPLGKSHHSIRDIPKDLLTYGTLMTLMTGYIVFMVINIRQYQCNYLITIHVIKKKNWIICPVVGVADITADILVDCWLTYHSLYWSCIRQVSVKCRPLQSVG